MIGLLRILFEADAYCPSCGHNRDKSSVSSIDHQDGTKSCQMCGCRWIELSGPLANKNNKNGDDRNRDPCSN
jgi:transcription elongation factor Elf1